MSRTSLRTREDDTGKTRRVAIFATNFVPYSQTFVHDELVRHVRYLPEVFVWRRMNQERFPFPDARVHKAGAFYPLAGHSRRFERVFESRRFDVVHAHFGPAGVLAQRYAARYRAPLVVTFHGYDVPLLRSLRRFSPEWLSYALGARRMLSALALGLCASQELLELLADYGVPRERLVRHPVGIDLSRFRFEGERKTPHHVIMIGRFVEKKGFAYGLEAFAHAARALPTATLSILGDGPLEASLRARARELGVGERVRFLGVCSAERVQLELRKAAVLLAPSVVARDGDRESGLVVVKEASACGTVPIGSLHGGIPEIIDDGRTGYLVAERDVAALSARLIEVLQDDALRRALARAGREKIAREYDVQRAVEALELHYDALALEASPSRAVALAQSRTLV